MVTTKPDLAFLDRIHDWTFNKNGPAGRLSNEVRSVQNRLRAKLRQAQRFIMDDDAIDIVAAMSREIDRLEAWSFLARLPYDTMWLQFSLHHKIEALRKLDSRMLPVNPDETPPVIGYLMFRDTDGPSPVWIAHEFYLTNEGKPFIGMLTYVFDPEGDPMWPIRGSKFWRSPTLSMRKGFPRIPVSVQYTGPILGEGETDEIDETSPSTAPPEIEIDMIDTDGDSVMITTVAAPEIALAGVFQPQTAQVVVRRGPDGFEIDEEMMIAPSWFINRGAVIVDPWWDHFFAARWRDDPDAVHRMLIHEVYECRGVMKFIITLLAAINGLPRDIRPIATRPGTRMVNMHRLPYLGHSHLRIELPRDNRIVYAKRALDRSAGTAMRRRQHYVLGHWRIVERGKKLPYMCRHMPTMVEHGLGICENCEMLIRWIAKYTRGDETLGMVDHDYEVTAKKRHRGKKALEL